MNSRRAEFDDALLLRVYSEFLEMPGLRLTCEQAQRLWGLDRGTCLDLLESLVDARFLYQPGHGTYTRLTDGSDRRPQLRTTSIRIDEDAAHGKKQAV